jgi:CBS-domain-containing membrane protein
MNIPEVSISSPRRLLDSKTPPAGAATLSISLGFITEPFHLFKIEVTIALLTLQAGAINRLTGRSYPLWSNRVRAIHQTPEPARIRGRG